MRALTPLDKVSVIDAATRKKLSDYWITSVEEFISTARASNQQYQSGRAALAVALGVGDDKLKAMLDAALPFLPPDLSFSVPVELDVGEGLFLGNFSDIDSASFGPPVALPPAVEPLAKLPKAAYQGVRNSCVAFSLAAIYQTLSNDATDLSEQFFYWVCKDRDKIPGDVGTDPMLAVRMLQEIGICTEATWPYKPTPSDSANPGHTRPPEQAFTEAGQRRIKKFQQLPGKDFRQIKAALAAGKPVLIGLPIWEHWQGAWQGQTRGRLRSPMPGERRKGGHAMCVVGYRDDTSAPGGGYFIVRNSWGPEWAKDNPDGPGYCHVPYKLVFEQGLAAIAVEGVQSASTPPAPGGTAAKVKPTGSLGGGTVSLDDVYSELQATRAELQGELKALRELLGAGQAAGGALPERSMKGEAATMTASDNSPDSLRAIHADATKLREQLNALISRMEALLDPTPTATTAAVVAAAIAPVAPLAAADLAAKPGPPMQAPAGARSGPLIFLAGKATRKEDQLAPLGLGLEGKPLLELDAEAGAAFAKGKFSAEGKEQISLFKAKKQSLVAHLGVTADISAQDLDSSRWAVVINALEDSALIKAVWPLIEHRMQQMKLTPPAVSFKEGENAAAWLGRHSDGGKQNLRDHWGKIPPVLIYRPGDGVAKWLGRHGVASGPVDPRRGVPYYLLILGRPGPLNADDEAHIPMNFQYLLDIFWGVGRLCFNDAQGQHRLDDYAAYAEKVINFEQASDAKERLLKEIVYFSTTHELDVATIRSTNELVTPLTRWHENKANTPAKLAFGKRAFIGEEASRANLLSVLSGSGQSKPPAILFTAGHGLGLPLSDERLSMHQGALITKEWSGDGPVSRDHWFAGENLGSDTKVEGMFAFLFACYGAGCPEKDEFVFDPEIGAEDGRPQVANFPLIAQLPQRLLVNGALGVLGHVDRAWTFSFSGIEDVKGQSQPFEDVLGRLLQGKRAGDATDQFNIIQGDRAMALTEELENIKFGKLVEDGELSRLWMARNDARNYALLGDPAARLPF